jgi:hypothetical protein
LSLDETYADVAPVRAAENQVSAYVSIMRGWSVSNRSSSSQLLMPSHR